VLDHRVDSVLDFLFLVIRIGTPHPSTHRRMCPPPLWGGGRERAHATRLREREWGSQFGRGDRHCGTQGKYVLRSEIMINVQEFIMGTMAAPTVYVFMWMIIFGGAGLRRDVVIFSLWLMLHCYRCYFFQSCAFLLWLMFFFL
jgi:hypothetical protein